MAVFWSGPQAVTAGDIWPAGHGTSAEKDALSDLAGLVWHGARQRAACLVQDTVQGVHLVPPGIEPIAVLHLLGWSA